MPRAEASVVRVGRMVGRLVGLLVSLLAATACTRYETIDVDGQTRKYLVHMPSGEAPAEGWPLVIAYHGAFSTPEATEDYTGLSALADAEGFVVVYPKGKKRRWSDGRIPDEVDDVGFTVALIDHAVAEYSVDERRVYATGISNGGFMSHRVGCDLGDRIAAIAPVAGTMSVELSAVCEPAQPVSVMLFMGTEDDFVPYEGGELGKNFSGETRGTMLSADDSVARWVELDGCPDAPLETTLDERDDGTVVTTRSWSGCDGGAELVFHSIDGGGHTWPGADDVALLGPVSHELDATTEMWAFFAAHSR